MTLGVLAVCRAGRRARSSPTAAVTERRRRRATVWCSSRCGSASLAVLLFCLFRPSLILKAAVPAAELPRRPDRRLAQHDDRRPRRPAAGPTSSSEQLGRRDGPLLNALSQRFVLRFFRFSSSADRLPAPADLQVRRHGVAARPGARARARRAGRPAARRPRAWSPTAPTPRTTSLDEPLASLKARSIPVFPVGVGQERFERDIQITRVETPRSTLKGTSLVGRRRRQPDRLRRRDGAAPGRRRRPDRQLAGRHAAGRRRVGDGARDLHRGGRRRRACSASGSPRSPTSRSRRTTRATRSSRSLDRREKVLYMEGEPRFEVKFIRRAVEGRQEPAGRPSCSGPPRTSTCRLDVGSPDELVGGFPKTREELFAYRAIILGSVEAASFSPDQLRMLADFVSKRGGGLLMLGGRRSFAEGGWAGTPVAEVLPVEFERSRAPRERQPEYFAQLVGAADARRLQLSRSRSWRTPRQARAREWNDCRPSATVNPMRRGEARRHGAADRAPTIAAGAGRARLPALRPRQVARVPDPGLVDLEDGRDRSPSTTRRTRRSGGGWSAGSSTACPIPWT